MKASLATSVILVLMLSCVAAHAQNDDAKNVDSQTGKVPIAVTISGGGSRGGYMAGQLFYLDHVRRLAGERFEMRVFTGASAGSINSLVATLASCAKAEARPAESLYFKTWIPTGLNEAFSPETTTATGILSRRGFARAIRRIERLWDAGLPTSCDVIIGIAVTRMRPHRVALAEGFPSLPRSLETVMVRITGRGAGKRPRVRNHVDPNRPTPAVLLPLDGPGVNPFNALRELVFASSAFPIGFAPVHLEHCMSTPGKPARCTKADAIRTWFIDGGVFDNQPLGLAVRAMRSLEVSAEEVRILDQPAARPPSEARFVYVDPRVSGLPTIPPARVAPADSALGVLGSMLTMVDSARSAELIRVFERFPRLRHRLLLTRTHLMPISSTFSGFLERSFREFDFYLGMYDAARTLRGGTWGGLTLPANAKPEVTLVGKSAAIRKAWRPFFCLQYLIDGWGEASACEGEALRDFRILAQLTFDRVYDHCRSVAEAGTELPATDHVLCRRAMNGWLAPRVAGVRDQPDEARRRREGESDIMYQLRLLGHYRFHFRDLGLAREEAERAPHVLIRLAHQMSRALADAQPGMSLPFGVIGRLGVDTALGYVPPEHIVHASIGLGFEVGYSFTRSDPNWEWLRLSLALELDGLSSVFNSRDNYLALVPKIGPEVEVLATSMVQLRVGARLGYQLSTGDAWTADPCNHANEDAVPCSRFATEAYVASSLLGLIRIHIAASWLPPISANQDAAFAVRPMIGLQLNSPF